MPYGAIWGTKYREMAGDAKSCKFCAASPLHQLDCANISCLLPINQPRIREKQKTHRVPVEVNSNYAKSLCLCITGFLLVVGIMAW